MGLGQVAGFGCVHPTMGRLEPQAHLAAGMLEDARLVVQAHQLGLADQLQTDP